MITRDTDLERHAEAFELFPAKLARAFEDGSDAYRAYGDGDAEALAYSPHVRLQEAFREGWDDAAFWEDGDSDTHALASGVL